MGRGFESRRAGQGKRGMTMNKMWAHFALGAAAGILAGFCFGREYYIMGALNIALSYYNTLRGFKLLLKK